MPTYIGGCDKVSCCIQFCRSLFLDVSCNGCNAVARDSDIPGSWPISEAGLSNDQVHKQFPPLFWSDARQFMVFHKILGTSVGAELPCPLPIYRPPIAFHTILFIL